MLPVNVIFVFSSPNGGKLAATAEAKTQGGVGLTEGLERGGDGREDKHFAQI